MYCTEFSVPNANIVNENIDHRFAYVIRTVRNSFGSRSGQQLDLTYDIDC